MKKSSKEILIYGWRNLNHSFALVNQNQLAALSKIKDIKLNHYDAPFYNPSWINNLNKSESNENINNTIKNLDSLNNLKDIDFIYSITYPFNLIKNNEHIDKRLAMFVVTEFGLSPSDFGNSSVDPKSYIDGDNLIITPSNWSRNKIIEAGFPEKKVFLVPHGVNNNDFYPESLESIQQVRAANSLLPDNYVFLNLGAMTWNKGVDLLLEAFFVLRQKYDHIRLILKDQSALYGISAKNSIELFLQEKSDQDREMMSKSIIVLSSNINTQFLRIIYNIADCYVSPYRAEGFNLTVLEAMACGTSIVVTEGGATDDFCNEMTIGKISSDLVRNDLLPHLAGKLYNNNSFHLSPRLDSLINEMDLKINSPLPLRKIVPVACAEFSWDSAVSNLMNVMN